MKPRSGAAFVWLRLALAVLALALAAIAWHFGAFDAFGDADRVRALIDSWGAWAYVLYLVTFAILMPFGIPAFFWVLPAGILWPFWIAYPLSLVAVGAGSSVGFVFARFIARDWVSARVPARIRRIDAAFSARGLRAVILFRLVFQLGAPTHWLLGLSNVAYGTFLCGTVIGAMPVVALVAWFGHDALRWVETHLALALGIACACAVGVLAVRRLLIARAAARLRQA